MRKQSNSLTEADIQRIERTRKQFEKMYLRIYPSFGQEDAEDFASSCVILWLSGVRDLATEFKYLLSDYRRYHYGREGVESRDAYRRPRTLRAKVDPNFHKDRSTDLERFLESDFIDNYDFPDDERMLLSMKYKWGLSLSEIGKVFGYGESWTSYVHTDALNRVRKIVEERGWR